MAQSQKMQQSNDRCKNIHTALARYLLVLLVSLFTCTVVAKSTPHTQAVPGGIVKVLLGDYQTQPRAYYKKKRLLVFTERNKWYALVGVPLKTPVGAHTIEVYHQQGTTTKDFTIEDYPYQEQRIRLNNRNYVEPDKQTLKRIHQDIKRTRAVYTQWDEIYNPLTQIPFAQPLAKGILTGRFGTKRFFNDQPRNPHSGIDIAAAAGTPVYAVADGKVTLTGDLFFNGKSVFINHSFGIISMYFHLQDISVHDGQSVVGGDVIGTVGSTGRSTGPHLHFGISVNNARVNPELFYAKNQLRNSYQK